MATIVNYDMDKIKTNSKDRVLSEDRGVINRIIKSIDIIGTIHTPIFVDKDGNLISGLNRYLSYKTLNKQTIPTIIMDVDDNLKKYIELSENVDRRHFTYLRYSQMLTEYKRVYEEQNPKSTKAVKVINNLKSIKKTELSVEDIPSFTKYFGDSSKKSERTLQNEIQLYKKLTNIDNEIILPLLHSLEDKCNMKLSKEELKNVINIDKNKLLKLVSILSDILKKNIKTSSNISLKSILIDLDGWENKQQITNEEILTFGLYELYVDKSEYKEILDSIEIDLVKYEKFKKTTKSHKNLTTVKKLLKKYNL